MKTTVTVENDGQKTRPMSEMRDGEVCIVTNGPNKGEPVIKVPFSDGVWMSLEDEISIESIWIENDSTKVRPLHKGEKVTITFEGE